jgi:hypothetical protein
MGNPEALAGSARDARPCRIRDVVFLAAPRALQVAATLVVCLLDPLVAADHALPRGSVPTSQGDYVVVTSAAIEFGREKAITLLVCPLFVLLPDMWLLRMMATSD